TVAICTQPAVTSTTPCSPLANLYTDSTLTVAAPNPLTDDSYGNLHFYATPGKYTVQYYGSVIPTTVIVDQTVSPPLFLGSLPLTCTAGVSPSVELSVAPYSIYYCGTGNVWTAVGSGGGGGVSGGTLGFFP